MKALQPPVECAGVWIDAGGKNCVGIRETVLLPPLMRPTRDIENCAQKTTTRKENPVRRKLNGHPELLTCRYVDSRQEASARNTIDRELEALKRMFRIGWQSTSVKEATKGRSTLQISRSLFCFICGSIVAFFCWFSIIQVRTKLPDRLAHGPQANAIRWQS